MILIKKNPTTPKPKHTPIEQPDFSEGTLHTPHQMPDKIQHIVLDPIVCGGKNKCLNITWVSFHLLPFITNRVVGEL